MKVILARGELGALDESSKDEEALENNPCFDCLKEIEECIPKSFQIVQQKHSHQSSWIKSIMIR